MGLGEYFTPLINIEDSDDAILAWEDSKVFNIRVDVENESKLEPGIGFDAQELEDNLMNDNPIPL